MTINRAEKLKDDDGNKSWEAKMMTKKQKPKKARCLGKYKR